MTDTIAAASPTPTTAPKTCCGPDCCASADSVAAVQSPAVSRPLLEAEPLVEAVRARYAEIAASAGSCCGSSPCGGALSSNEQRAVALGIGYTAEELAALPEGANLGLGCGAPVPALALRHSETVLDLGSGAGLDAFLAAALVGPTGRVLGVDMTPEMIDRAHANATRFGHANVEFRLGRLESLPVEDASIDAVTSNCVVNLVPDKKQVFREVARVLKPGGRLVISDIVLDRPLPPAIADDLFAYAGCVAGAARREQYFADLGAAGLGEVEVLRDVDYLASVREMLPEEVGTLLARAGVSYEQIAGSVRSVTFRARRPLGATA